MTKKNKGKAKAAASNASNASSDGATSSGGAPAVVIRRSRRDAPTPKRHRPESDDEEYESATEVDPAVLVDSLLACLIKNESLLEGFIQDLFHIPSLQDKIVSHVLGLLKESSTENVVNQSVKSVTNNLNDTIKELSSNVRTLTDELKQSKRQCDDLEQYSRRNNIIISGIPESDSTDSETLACNFVNRFVDTPIDAKEIDRAHRITRPSTRDRQRPRDIIVKFCSYKSKSAVLSRIPMIKLRKDNADKPDRERVYIREDLTKSRNTLMYKTRVLKRERKIKNTFSRDGRIVIKLFTDRLVYLTSEDDLINFCNKHNINSVNSNTESKSTNQPNSSEKNEKGIAMDTESACAGKSAENAEATCLDPEATTFIPSQLSQCPGGMGPMSQLPNTQCSPSQSLFHNLNT